jgi:hypothetical protein
MSFFDLASVLGVYLELSGLLFEGAKAIERPLITALSAALFERKHD